MSAGGPLNDTFGIGANRIEFDLLNFGIRPGNSTRSPVRSNALPLITSDVNTVGLASTAQAFGETFELMDLIFSLGPACLNDTAGDIDGDGQVAFSDFLILSNNFGDDVQSHELGDIDCSGTVDFADFLVLADNFGEEVAVSNVPEPNVNVYLLILLLCLSSTLRGKRNDSFVHRRTRVT